MMNPHDAQLELCWSACRFGSEAVRSPERRTRVLAWIERMRALFPGSPYLEAWSGIVSGDEHGALDELRTCRTFAELSESRRSFWRPLVQSQPFACIVPGRTTRERRSVLSRLP